MKNIMLQIYIWIILCLLPVTMSTICKTQPGRHLNFSHQQLSSIPSHIAPDVVELDISNNNIRTVHNNTFEGLSKIWKLDLSRNKIQRLESRAFYGLKQLCLLDMRQNMLSMNYDSFPIPVFKQVPELRILHIEGNVFPGPSDTTYPDKSLQNLKSLRLFYADTFPGLRLGEGFSSLSSLEEFHSQRGDIGKISNESLAPLAEANLKKLILAGVGIRSIETGAFLNVKRLELLDLTGNGDQWLNNALHALYGIQHRNMTDIKLADINGETTHFQDSVLDATNVQYLSTICVANLDLSRNRISYVDKQFLASLKYPECLRRLSFRGHQIIQRDYNALSLFELMRFRHLEYLDISGGYHPSVRKRRSVTQIISTLLGDNHDEIEETIKTDQGLLIKFFPSLKVFNMSGGLFKSTLTLAMGLRNATKLRVLDMSNNGFDECVSFFSGIENLTVLNITGFDCSHLSPQFLSSVSGLEVLEVKGLRLNKGLQSDRDGIFLRQQKRLKKLNMADNGLNVLHPELFCSLRLLRDLDLGNNKFKELPRAVRSMTSVTHLDVSYNSLITLNDQDRKWLERVSQLNKKQHIDFHISLYGNPFVCTCSTLDFVHWFLTTDIHIELKNNLTCSLENGTRTYIVNLKDNINDMRIACVSSFWLTFSVTVSSLTVLTLCIGAFCYRYRHNIKYWFLTNCRRRSTYEQIPPDDCQFDAFVAYNHEDYRWTCHTLREFLEDVHGYRLCLHHRDFPVGESIQGNIVDAINSSRKIILVISRRFLACNWGEFEIQMAGMRMVQSGRDNVVIAIMLEEIPVRKMPRSLLIMWKKITFLLWTNEPGDENIFWGKLAEAMARN